MGHFLWGTGIGAYASYTEIIKFSEKVGIGFGFYAVNRHSILSDYFSLAAVQNSWINFGLRHLTDARGFSVSGKKRPNLDSQLLLEKKRASFIF